MKGEPLIACIFLLSAAAAQAPADGANPGDWCATRGGLCRPRDECLQTTNVLAGYCDEGTVCCVPKSVVCEKWRSGFCTNDIVRCTSKPGHQVTGLVCAADSVCCVPTYSPPPQPAPGAGSDYPYDGRYGYDPYGCPGCMGGHRHRGWHHGGWGWGRRREGWVGWGRHGGWAGGHW